MNLDHYRVINDPELTSDAIVYEVQEADGRDDFKYYPVLYRIDVTIPDIPILSMAQPGPWEDDSYIDITMSLDTLITIGQLAAAIKEQQEHA